MEQTIKSYDLWTRESTSHTIPDGVNWLDFLDSQVPGFKQAYCDVVRWRVNHPEVLLLPQGARILPKGEETWQKRE